MDDTDSATLAQIRPFYDALRHYGMRTTKTIWPLPSDPADEYWGEDLSHPPYRAWLHELQKDGFEISYHGARSGGSPRPVTLDSLERFKEEFAGYPLTYANHASNIECVYWGSERFDIAPFRALYRGLRNGPKVFKGSTDTTPYYWADACRQAITYVRNFTYTDIVTSNVDRFMPYYDPRRPFVRAWFSASEGANATDFLALLSERNVERLVQSRGASIVYTHVAWGFVENGRLDPKIERALANIASQGGWFVPVCTLLEELERRRGLHTITRIEHADLELRWVLHHASKGLASLSDAARPR
jgi:hypothetical protein